MKNPYVIGLTGNLGSGKSTVRKMLEQLGARGIDADELAHVAMQRGTPTWRAVVDTFGAEILAFNGRIDRHKLGARVFSDAEGLRKLEAIVHPAVGALTKQMVRDAREPVVVIEAIKLVEAGLHAVCDAVWVVKCASEAQIERVMRNRRISEADVRARLAAQSPLEEKLRFATAVIDNSADESTTRAQVEQAWRAIRPESARDKSDWLLESASREAPRPALAVADEQTSIIEHETSQLPAPQSIEKKETAPPIPVWARSRLSVSDASAPSVIDKDSGPSLQMPSWARVDIDIEVRRARRSDLDALGVAIAKLENRDKPLARKDALRRLGERGYRIAITDKRIVALAAWDAENLVATVREIWAESADVAPVVLPKLFALIESEAIELLCEVILLLIDESALTLSAEALAFGYEQRELPTLHPVWQSVARERAQATDQIWFKRLREEFTSKPV